MAGIYLHMDDFDDVEVARSVVKDENGYNRFVLTVCLGELVIEFEDEGDAAFMAKKILEKMQDRPDAPPPDGNSPSANKTATKKVVTGKLIKLEVDQIVGETEKAFKVAGESGTQFWIPKSQIANSEDYGPGDCDLVLSVTEWWAKRAGVDHE